MLSPIVCDQGVDFPRFRIPDLLGISVRSDRTEDRLPDSELFRGPSVSSHNLFAPHRRLHHCFYFAFGVPHLRTRHAPKWTFSPEGVLVSIDVADLVGAKINGIGTGGPGAVEVV